METKLISTPKEITREGMAALQELKALITKRPDKEKLIINGRQYLYFADWQLLGAYFGITTWVVETREITKEVSSEDNKMTFIETLGFHARAVAKRNGVDVSAAEAECRFDEEIGGKRWWANKPRFQLLSMAQTRACSKALRNCLQWVVRLPSSTFSEEVAEEISQGDLL